MSALSFPATERHVATVWDGPSRVGARAFALGWLLLAGAITGLTAALFAASWYREEPQFWRNSGGYALWLRELVLLGFYPGVLIALLAQISLTRSLFRGWHGSARTWGLALALVAFGWLLLTASLGMAWADNLSNLLDAKPPAHTSTYPDIMMHSS